MKETSDDGDTCSIADSCSIGSRGSSVNDLTEFNKKYSHVCILTYWTKDRVVCGVD
ncbi:hypothetical protein AVEN_7971-1, partial [Araneus ventricosus]